VAVQRSAKLLIVLLLTGRRRGRAVQLHAICLAALGRRRRRHAANCGVD
jgi:hypothetical protein